MSCSDDVAKEINYLFELMLGFFPSIKSTLAIPEDFNYMKRKWVIGLKLAGIIVGDNVDKDMFYTGINCLPFFNSQYMPSLGQFVNMCIYGVDGIESNSGRLQEDTVQGGD